MKKLKRVLSAVLATLIIFSSGSIANIGMYSTTVYAATSDFTDVSSGSVGSGAYKAITWAKEAGLTNGYSDGTFKPENNITRSEAVIMLWRLAGKETVNYTLDFSDIDSLSGTALSALKWAVSENIIKGYSDETFRPDDEISRAEFSIIIWRLAGRIQSPKTYDFTDTSSSASYYKALAWCTFRDIIRGYSDGSFKPEASIKRQELAIMLYRLCFNGAADTYIAHDYEASEQNYSIWESERELLAYVVWGETARVDNTDDYYGAYLMGCVVINRIYGSSWFPDSIYDVVYQNGQFVPSYYENLKRNGYSPNAACYAVVDEILNANLTPSGLIFADSRSSAPNGTYLYYASTTGQRYYCQY